MPTRAEELAEKLRQMEHPRLYGEVQEQMAREAAAELLRLEREVRRLTAFDTIAEATVRLNCADRMRQAWHELTLEAAAGMAFDNQHIVDTLAKAIREGEL